MNNIDWELIGVILTVIMIVVMVIIGYFQLRRRSTKNHSKKGFTQNIKQEVHIYPKKEINKKKKIQKTPKKLEKKTNEELKSKWEQLYEDSIVAPSGWHEKLRFPLNKGDRIKGIASEVGNYEFNCYVMKETEYSKYQNDVTFKSIKSYRNKPSISIDLTIPSDDIWYFVFDVYQKQYDREIEVTLRRIPNREENNSLELDVFDSFKDLESISDEVMNILGKKNSREAYRYIMENPGCNFEEVQSYLTKIYGGYGRLPTTFTLNELIKHNLISKETKSIDGKTKHIYKPAKIVNLKSK